MWMAMKMAMKMAMLERVLMTLSNGTLLGAVDLLCYRWPKGG